MPFIFPKQSKEGESQRFGQRRRVTCYHAENMPLYLDVRGLRGDIGYLSVPLLLAATSGCAGVGRTGSDPFRPAFTHGSSG